MVFSTETREPKRIPYADYGSFVFCNGERRRDREDTVPFHEKEVEYEFMADVAWMRALIVRPGANWHGGMHAVLGDGGTRIAVFRLSVRYLTNAYQAAIESPPVNENEDTVFVEFASGMGAILWKRERPNSVDVKWIDEIGNVWLARCGLHVGCRFEDVPERPLVKELMRELGVLNMERG